MLLSGHSSPPDFINKSKSNGDEGGAKNTPYDIIEHDVAGLAMINNLPPPDSFDALHLGTDRYELPSPHLKILKERTFYLLF